MEYRRARRRADNIPELLLTTLLLLPAASITLARIRIESISTATAVVYIRAPDGPINRLIKMSATATKASQFVRFFSFPEQGVQKLVTKKTFRLARGKTLGSSSNGVFDSMSLTISSEFVPEEN